MSLTSSSIEPTKHRTVLSGTPDACTWAITELHMSSIFLFSIGMCVVTVTEESTLTGCEQRLQQKRQIQTQHGWRHLDQHCVHVLEIGAACNQSMCKTQMNIQALHSANAKTFLGTNHAETSNVSITLNSLCGGPCKCNISSSQRGLPFKLNCEEVLL